MTNEFEATLRLSAFLGVLAVMLVWELVAPRRRLSRGRPGRWLANLGLVFLNTFLLRISLGAFAVTAAVYAGSEGVGLFNWLELPYLMALILSVVLLDMAIYWQHRLFHVIPLFWRLHRLHHADVDFDTTTGVRFHPIEIFLSILIKAALVLALGAPIMAVVVFEVLLSATSLFNHGNVKIPLPVDRLLRMVLVTPDMHRVHHSVIRRETDSNFGFSVPWWDYLFASYCAEPEAGQDDMEIGLPILRDKDENRIDKLLTQPFRNPD
jgi:sterol desaturase/sphingolipid hydroxylase (fatty acid hydroxylase superfamily)